MLDPADYASYREAIRTAATATALNTEVERRRIAESYWAEAIHGMLVRKGCPCTRGEDGCFLKLNPIARKEKLGGSDLSYENFLEILEEALAMALATMSPCGDA